MAPRGDPFAMGMRNLTDDQLAEYARREYDSRGYRARAEIRRRLISDLGKRN